MNDDRNRWDESGHKTKERPGAFAVAANLGAKFLGLSRNAKIAVAVVAFLLIFGITGTVLSWLFSAFAFVGRLLLIAIVLFFVVGWFKARKK